jgi:hypothetical protein
MQAGWQYVRQEVAAADSTNLLGGSNSDWGNREARGRGIPILPGTRGIVLAFIGDHATNPNNGTASVKVSLYRSGGPAQAVQSFDLTVGNQLANYKPTGTTKSTTAKWVDTIIPSVATPSNYWLAEPMIFGGLADNVAAIGVKTYGAAFITVEVTALGSGIILDVLMSGIDDAES